MLRVLVFNFQASSALVSHGSSSFSFCAGTRIVGKVNQTDRTEDRHKMPANAHLSKSSITGQLQRALAKRDLLAVRSLAGELPTVPLPIAAEMLIPRRGSRARGLSRL